MQFYIPLNIYDGGPVRGLGYNLMYGAVEPVRASSCSALPVQRGPGAVLPGLRSGGGVGRQRSGSGPVVPGRRSGRQGRRQGRGRLQGRIFRGQGAHFTPLRNFPGYTPPAHFPGHSRQIRFFRAAHFCFFKIFPGAGTKLPSAFFRNLIIFFRFFAQNLRK